MPAIQRWPTGILFGPQDAPYPVLRTTRNGHSLKPHRVETSELSNDPRFAEKLEDIVDLYLNPPEHRLVLALDEKSQIQALDHTQPGSAMKKGRAPTMTRNGKRYETIMLFAALSTLDGSVTATCTEHHRHQEWLKFLRLIDHQTPAAKQLHLIVDKYATHKHPAVQRWTARRKRVPFHFTPTCSSSLNMVERFFGDLTENQVWRGVFTRVAALEERILARIEEQNRQPKPFIWTAKANFNNSSSV
jgi:transposase